MLCRSLLDSIVLFQPRQCGVRDPSWSEVRYFVTFLDIQLQSCEQSIFCDEKLVGDVMSGLKSFVVNFMIAMAKVSSKCEVLRLQVR